MQKDLALDHAAREGLFAQGVARCTNEALISQSTWRADIMIMARRVVIVCTAANEAQADAYRTELEVRRSRGTLPESCSLVLSVADPCGADIGSGGGVLNALVAIADEFNAAEPPTAASSESRAVASTWWGDPVSSASVSASWLDDTLILVVLHSVDDSQCSPSHLVCGTSLLVLGNAARVPILPDRKR